MLTIDGLVGALALEPTGPTATAAGNADAGHGVIFGGQLLAQSVDRRPRRATTARPSRPCTRSSPAAGRPDAPVEIAVDRMHAGRAFASSTVTISQGDRLCARSLVLLSADEPDFIRHADPAPDAAGPGDGAPAGDERRRLGGPHRRATST